MKDRITRRGQRITLRCRDCRVAVEVETGTCSDAVLYDRLSTEIGNGVFCRGCRWKREQPQLSPEERIAQARKDRKALFE